MPQRRGFPRKPCPTVSIPPPRPASEVRWRTTSSGLFGSGPRNPHRNSFCRPSLLTVSWQLWTSFCRLSPSTLDFRLVNAVLADFKFGFEGTLHGFSPFSWSRFRAWPCLRRSSLLRVGVRSSTPPRRSTRASMRSLARVTPPAVFGASRWGSFRAEEFSSAVTRNTFSTPPRI